MGGLTKACPALVAAPYAPPFPTRCSCTQLHAHPARRACPGVLTGGLLPAVGHALHALLDPAAPGPLVLPAGVDVIAQPVAVSSARCRAAAAAAYAAAATAANGGPQHQQGTDISCTSASPASVAASLDLGELEALRWAPSQALPAPLARCALAPAAAARAVWSFDCLAPPDCAGRKEIDVTFDVPLPLDPLADGNASSAAEGQVAVDAVAVWARVRLCGGVELTTGACVRVRRARASAKLTAPLARRMPVCSAALRDRHKTLPNPPPTPALPRQALTSPLHCRGRPLTTAAVLRPRTVPPAHPCRAARAPRHRRRGSPPSCGCPGAWPSRQGTRCR